MRAAIVALVAIALVSPSAAFAADANRPAEPAPAQSAPAQAAPKKMERIAFPRRHRQMVRRHLQRKKASAARVKKQPEVARPAPTIESQQPGAVAPPACVTNPNLDNGRRCLRLVAPAPLPTPAPLYRPSAEAYVAPAPFASPSRSWFGAFGKRIVTGVIEIAEVLFVDRAEWRTMMADDIQSQLERARSKDQQGRLKDRSKQNVG